MKDRRFIVETHFGKLCVILRSRVLRVVCPHLRIFYTTFGVFAFSPGVLPPESDWSLPSDHGLDYTS